MSKNAQRRTTLFAEGMKAGKNFALRFPKANGADCVAFANAMRLDNIRRAGVLEGFNAQKVPWFAKAKAYFKAHPALDLRSANFDSAIAGRPF